MTSPTVAERIEIGRDARRDAPRGSHAAWSTPTERIDPVDVIEAQNASRVPFLVPVRHGRMSVNPFTFYRGAAAIMAADLATTPSSGLEVQLGGDAHLSNFGAYASPERQLIVDANDFDETLPGPFEWDLKRLAASFTIAGQHLGLAKADTRRVTNRVTAAYRRTIAELAEMRFLDAWNVTYRVEDLTAAGGIGKAELEERITRFQERAKKKTSLQAVGKLTEVVDGRRHIIHDPPVLFPLDRAPLGHDPAAMRAAAEAAFEQYKVTLDDARSHLVDRYRLVDVGIKVVGVGSVGTRALVLLLEGRDGDDWLVLQAKEAGPSVLEGYLGASRYPNHGQRVVEGQRMVQAQSDPFLGWTEGHIEGRHFYLRQLRDWKGSVEIEGATANQLRFYADLCGRILARGHARSGDAAAIAAYCGRSDRLDRAITSFSEAYAEQNRQDYVRFLEAIDNGRLEATDGV